MPFGGGGGFAVAEVGWEMFDRDTVGGGHGIFNDKAEAIMIYMC